MSAWFARKLVALRWWVIGFWVVATLAALLVLPDFSDSGQRGGIEGILSADTPAVRTEKRSVELFGFPLIARTVVVQRDARGLSPYAQARTVVRAVAVDSGKAGDVLPLLGALPLTNTAGLFPGSAEKNTTALTYLLFAEDTSVGKRTRAARDYAKRFFSVRDHVVGVTGSAPARTEQGHIIGDSLPNVEIATLLAIVLIVAASFRSLVAPLVALATTAVAYVATMRLSGGVTALLNLPSPDELKPVVVALLLGVVTDYVVFFCSALRTARIALSGRAAVIAAVTRSGPIVAVAGLAVAAGTATLLAAQSPFFRALGPALAFTVLVGLLVAITLVPALIAVLGDLVFWPVPHPPRPPRSRVGSQSLARVVGRFRETSWERQLVEAIVARRAVAAAVVAVCAGGMIIAAAPLLRLELGASFVSSLPQSAPAREAAQSAQQGFSAGILSPTVVLLEGKQIGARHQALSRFGELLAQQPGVSSVVGPGSQPFPLNAGLLVTRSNVAARYLVVLDSDPLGADAVTTLDSMRNKLPVLLRSSGLADVRVGVAGDSATASFLVHQTQNDLLRIALAAVAANFLMLLLFLRAVVASVFLLMSSLLSLGATLGITTAVFGFLDPGQGLTFYVPFATAVLLLAFGSDYNIFTVGHVWETARKLPLQAALTTALPANLRAVMTAGAALAASFGLLALVPLLPFRQLAFAMTLGIVLDVAVVRSLLVPALLRLVGNASAWPSRRLRDSPQRLDRG